MDQLPRLGKRELICLLLFTCNYVVSVWRGFLFLCVLGLGYVILLWHSLSLPYNYFGFKSGICLLIAPVPVTFCIGKKMKTVDFSETIVACDLKVGRCGQLIKLM